MFLKHIKYILCCVFIAFYAWVVVEPLGAFEKQRAELAQNTAGKTTSASRKERIGIVVSSKGKTFLLRNSGKKVFARSKSEVFEKDHIKTADQGYLQVTFSDGSILKLIGKSDISVDHFIFDQGEKKASGQLSTDGATFVFLSGKIGKVAPENFKIKTSQATIGIKGSTIDASVTPDSLLLTGGDIYAEPIGGGQTVEFVGAVPEQAFAISSEGVEAVSLPEEGSFFQETAQEIFGDDADSITETQIVSEEQDEQEETSSEEDEQEDEQEDESTEDEQGEQTEEAEQEDSQQEQSSQEESSDGEQSSQESASLSEGDDSTQEGSLNSLSFEEEDEEEGIQEGGLSMGLSEETESGLSDTQIDLSVEIEVDLGAILQQVNESASAEQAVYGVYRGRMFDENIRTSVELTTLREDWFLELTSLGIPSVSNFSLFAKDFATLEDYSSLAEIPFFVFHKDTQSKNLGYMGIELLEDLPSTGIQKFASPMSNLQQGGGIYGHLYGGVLSKKTQDSFQRGESEIYLNYNTGQVFGFLKKVSSFPDASLGLLSTASGGIPFAFFYSDENSVNTMGIMEDANMHLYSNYALGDVFGSLYDTNDLFTTKNYDGGGQIFGADSIQGIGLWANASQDESGAFLAAGFKSGALLSPESGPSQYDVFSGYAQGINIQLNASGNLSSYGAASVSAFDLSLDLEGMQIQASQSKMQVGSHLWVGQTASNLLVDLESFFSVLQGGALDPQQSFLLATELPQLDTISGEEKPEGVSWGVWNGADTQTTIYPGQMNYWVAGNLSDPSVFFDGSDQLQSSFDYEPIRIYAGVSRQTLADPNLIAADHPFSAQEGVSRFVMNFEDRSFKHYSLFSDGFLLLAQGDLDEVDTNDANSGGLAYGFDSNQWQLVSLSSKHSQEALLSAKSLLDATSNYPNSFFEGAFAASQGNSLIYSYSRQHGASGASLVHGVGVAALADSQISQEYIAISTGWVAGVLVDAVAGEPILDLWEEGENIDFRKIWKEESDPNNPVDLDVAWHVNDPLKPVYEKIEANSQEKEVLTLYSEVTGGSNSSRQQYSAEIDPTNAALEDLSFSYSFNAQDVLDAFSSQATGNPLPFQVVIYAKDDSDNYYYIESEEKNYSAGDFSNWITESYSFTSGGFVAIKVASLSELLDENSIETQVQDRLSGVPGGYVALNIWLEPPGYSQVLIPSDAKAFKVFLRWGDASYMNAASGAKIYLEQFTLNGSSGVLIQEDFAAYPLTEDLFITKDAFYIPDESAQAFVPDISGYTRVDNKTLITGLPGLEEFDYLLWGIWKSEYSLDANPSEKAHFQGYYGGGILDELSDPSGLAAFKSAHPTVSYQGKALGTVYDLVGGGSQFHVGHAEMIVNFNSGSITSGTVSLGDVQILMGSGTIDELKKGLPFSGSLQLKVSGSNPSGSGQYKGQFFGNNPYAKEASGSFNVKNTTKQAVGAFGVKRN